MQIKSQAAVINNEKLLVTFCFTFKVKIGIFKIEGVKTETVRGNERES